jgi:hypothetical protein
MEPDQITPEASLDIAELAQGGNRVEVAIKALEESELTQDQVQKLEALLKRVSAPSATTVSEIKTIDGHQAVVGQIFVEGQQLDTLLTEGSFSKTRADQIAYAERLGYRLATREEHLAYVEDLLAKEENKTINDAEKNALETYLQRYMRDTDGGLDVDGRGVRPYGLPLVDRAFPSDGALFVRASAESK